MKRPFKHIAVPILFISFLLLGMVVNITTPTKELSEAERRALKQFPSWTFERLFDSEYYASLETYALDQFILRDQLRSINAHTRRHLFFQRDVNGIYFIDDHILSMEYPLNESSIIHAGTLIDSIIDSHLSEHDIYYGIIPDKNYFVAPDNGYPHIDYTTIVDLLSAHIEGGEYIEIKDTLVLNDFFRTDHHLRQDGLHSMRNKLFNQFGITPPETSYRIYHEHRDFNGSYYGQAALPVKSDTIRLLSNDMIETMSAYDVITGETVTIYDIEALEGINPYNVFLGGQQAITKIENPHATNDENLVIFGDSYATALAPLLAEGYQSLTLIDLRFVSHEILDQYIDFTDQTILFLYSVPILNDSYMSS